MTEDQIIRAGGLALSRKSIRQAAREPMPITLTVKGGDGKTTTIALDIHSTRAALNAVDQDLSDRLAKLGVAEI